MRNGQVTDGLDTSHSGKVRALFAAQRVARPTADSANQPFDHVGDPGPFLQQTPPLALPRVGHHNRGSSRRAAFCARSKHPLAVRYYEYGQMEYGDRKNAARLCSARLHDHLTPSRTRAEFAYLPMTLVEPA
jgi:hypothetical protein